MRGERGAVGCLPVRVSLRRGGKLGGNQIQQHPHAHVAGGRAADDGDDLSGGHAVVQAALNLGVGQFLAIEVLFHQHVVILGGGLNQLLPITGDGLLQVVRDALRVVHSLTILKGVGLQMHQVNDAVKRRAVADGNLGGGDGLAVAGADGVDKTEVVRVILVHLVDEDGAGQAVALSVVPGGVEADIGAAAVLRGHDEEGRLDHLQRGGDLAEKVRVAGRVNEIDLHPVPLAGGECGVDAGLALDFFRVKIGDSGTVFNASLAVNGPGNIEERFGEGSLPCAAVSDKCNVAYGVYGVPAHHPLRHWIWLSMCVTWFVSAIFVGHGVPCPDEIKRLKGALALALATKRQAEVFEQRPGLGI